MILASAARIGGDGGGGRGGCCPVDRKKVPAVVGNKWHLSSYPPKSPKSGLLRRFVVLRFLIQSRLLFFCSQSFANRSLLFPDRICSDGIGVG